MRERRVWRFLNCMSTPCDMQSFIVWVIAGIAERVMVRKAMRCMRELRAMTFFVAQPMKTGEGGILYVSHLS
jgi:hypothetical protein